MNARVAAVEDLERRIGHVFADRGLLERALTHSSVRDRRRSAPVNELLEFLGDRVLNLIIAEQLVRRLPDRDEGELSRAFHQLVNLKACADVARQVGLGEALRLGGGAGKLGMRRSDRILGDACEALIAAIYLDGGLDAAQAFVGRFWSAAIADVDSLAKDPKTSLQHWALARGLPLPEYRLMSTVGPAHDPVFTVEVFVKGFQPEVGNGRSKKEAERLVAQRLLERLERAP